MNDTHPMLAKANRDEMAEQLFVRDLKSYIVSTVEPQVRRTMETCDPGVADNARAEKTYDRLKALPGFAHYLSLRRASQDLLWTVVGNNVERQSAELNQLAGECGTPSGSLALDPEMDQPKYLEDRDVHLMPGGYANDPGGVEQGALMDRGGAVYMLGRNGGFLNDGRGWALLSHLLARWPELSPDRIVELGCGIGSSIVPVAGAFPDAEVHGIDVGASMLRYAHARAEHLGVAVHFRQGDAERAPYPDASFDCVFSCALMHETSERSLGRIMEESFRLLRPGGVVAHLEVPQRYDDLSLWTMIQGEIEHEYNNEPNWKTAISADYSALLTVTGFDDVATGFQDAARSGVRGNAGFGSENKGVFRSWYVASGVKPG